MILVLESFGSVWIESCRQLRGAEELLEVSAVILAQKSDGFGARMRPNKAPKVEASIQFQ